MTEKQEEFLRRFNELLLDFDINRVYPIYDEIVFESNHKDLRIEKYQWLDGTPTFQGLRSDFVPGAATYERTK